MFFIFLIRFVLVCLWMGICCIIGFARILVRWGDLDHNTFFAHLYSWGGAKILGWKLEVEGQEHLETGQPRIYVSNHQSNLDMVPCGWVFPKRCVLIGKKELLLIPFFGLYFAGAGNILLDRQKKAKAFAGLDQAVDIMKSKNASIWVFPEGTRNRSSEFLQPFKKGAFYMAIQAQVPVVAVCLQPMKPLVDIWKGIARSGTFRVKVLPPISTVGMKTSQVEELLQETHRQMKVAILGLNARP